jgi:GT2 family glycosyltransferase
VSIVVPVYNGERYLRESLDSILAQSYPRVEVLVMDDASTDATPAILAGYADRVVVVRQPTNKGQFANVNDGIARAAGCYIGVFHADDVYDADILREEVAFLERHPDAGAVFCLDRFIDADGAEYDRLAIPPELPTGTPLPFEVILPALLTYKNTFLVGPSALVRAEVYRKLGAYRGEAFGIAADLEMWVRIAQHHALGIIPRHLMAYRHGHGNLSQRHYHLRTEPEAHFRILDACLAAGTPVILPAALAAHEAHRAQDHLMLAANRYILGQRAAGWRSLRSVQLRALVGSPRIQRLRMVVLYLALAILLRLPRIPPVAEAMYRRWHVKPPGRDLDEPRGVG